MATYSNRIRWLFEFYLNKLPPDEPLGETSGVILLFYSDVQCFKLYTIDVYIFPLYVYNIPHILDALTNVIEFW